MTKTSPAREFYTRIGHRIPKVRSLGQNRVGRDFVVGDLHGDWDTLARLLGAVEFANNKDRLFCTGNLTDWGTQSLECLHLLRQPWFFCARGQHDQALIEHLRQPETHAAWDDTWLQQVAGDDREQFAGTWLPLLEALPYVVNVGTGLNQFHVVHGEILDEHQAVTDSTITTWTFERPDRAAWRAIQGSSLIKSWLEGKPVLRAHDRGYCGQIYGGHVVVPAVIQLAQHIYMNRGAGIQTALTERGAGARRREGVGAKAGRDHLFMYEHIREALGDAMPFEFEPGMALAEPLTQRVWFASTRDNERPVHPLCPIVPDMT